MYIAKIDTVINYVNFNKGDVVPNAFVTERLKEIGVLEFAPDPKPEIKEIKEDFKPFKKSKKKEILTEDTAEVEISVE